MTITITNKDVNVGEFLSNDTRISTAENCRVPDLNACCSRQLVTPIRDETIQYDVIDDSILICTEN